MQDFGDRWGEWPGDGDPIGIASARLFALGVERTRRLAALRFLGILLDHAGRDGVVRADPDTLAGEFRLERADTRAHVAVLERAGLLTSGPDGLRISGFEHHRPTGLPEGEAMALIASVLGSPAPGTSPEPARADVWLEESAGEPVLEPVLEGAGAPGGAGGNRRIRQPVGAVLAVMTGIVLVAAGVFAQPSTDRVELSDVAADRPGTTLSIPTTVGGAADPLSTGAAPEATVPGREPAGPTSVPGSTETTRVPGTGTEGGSVAAESVCPTQVPLVTDVVAEVEPADLTSVVSSSPWVVSVEGLLVAGGETASVTSIPVVVHFSDGSQVAGEALAAPVLLEPGHALRWSTTIDAGATTVPEVSSVSAGAPLWQWADPELAGACPAS